METRIGIYKKDGRLYCCEIYDNDNELYMANMLGDGTPVLATNTCFEEYTRIAKVKTKENFFGAMCEYLGDKMMLVGARIGFGEHEGKTYYALVNNGDAEFIYVEGAGLYTKI